jgi:UDP-glucose 4-epimerase
VTRHLILGGLGFIGRHVAVRLAAKGEDATIFDQMVPTEDMVRQIEADAGRPVDFLQGDMANADWTALLAAVDVVHHYAWSTIPQTANEDPIGDLDANVRNTLRLLEAMRTDAMGEASVKRRLVFASSGGTVYGRLQKTPVPESHPFAPITAYGVSKVAVELYLGFYRSIAGLDCRIARISNPFGAGQSPTRLQGAASAFLFKALAGEQIDIWGDGSVVRDFIHVSDLAEGLSSIALASQEDIGPRPAFNIGSGVGISLSGIVATIAEHLGRELDVRYHPARPFDVAVSVLDIAHARERCHWSPQLTFSEGCDRMIRDLKSGRTWLSTPLG